ncbi:MAG: HAD family phosphatase [archaeon]
MIKGVIFDFDGVIVDTEKKRFRDLRQILAKKNISLQQGTFHRLIGKKTEAFIKEIFPSLPADTISSMVDERRKMNMRNIKGNKLLPGIKNLLHHLKSKKYTLALVTGTKKDLVKTVLETNGLMDYFDLLVTGESFKSSKPDPECYMIALKRLRLPKEEVVIIEDSAAGVAAGKRLGITVFAIPTYLPKKDLVESDRIFENHAEIKKFFMKQEKI